MPFITMILSWLGNLLGGPFAKAAVDAYKAKLDAGNTHDRIAADLAGRELAVEQREQELQAQLVIAEQGNWFTRWVRPMWAAPFVIYTWKGVFYDKVLGFWTHSSTDPLGDVFGPLMVTVAAAYFGGRTIEKVAQILKK